MFFRADDKIIAVITLLRSEAQGDFSADDLMLLRKLQPFLEFTLNTVYLPPRLSERRSIEQRYQLTARELDVVERLISGASNKAIAEEMMLGLPTVKTHLQHIYQKANVVSRAELLSRIIADLQEDA
jgi:DNA-binding CsgD family transcriptional regulator